MKTRLTTAFHNHVSVDCVIFGYDEVENKLQVLLIEQKEPEQSRKERFQAQYALPGDLVNEEESLEEAAERVLKELTSLQGLYLRQFYAFGDPGRVADEKDAEWLEGYRTDPKARVITIAFFSLVRIDKVQPAAGSFAKRTIWRSTRKIPKLAFDHNQILTKAINELKSYIDHPDVLTELLPKKFTLSQLQNLLQAISGIELDKRNFRKSLKSVDFLIELDEKQKGVLHKPARLYSFKKTRRKTV